MAVSVAGALVLVSIADGDGFRRYLALEQEVNGLRARNETLREENERYRREIDALRGDPAALERAAREELGFIKPGEIVLNVE